MLIVYSASIVSIVLLASRLVSSNTVNDLCTRCSGSASNALVGLNCSKTTNASVVRRCCVQNTSNGPVVIGLDWSNCSITRLDPYQLSGVGDSLQWLDLSGNDIHFSTSLHDRWLGGLTRLELLLLPKGVNCSKEAWNTIKLFGVNNTLQLCSNPLYCNASTDGKASNNSVCPPDSHCVPDGPGLHQCLCNSDHHGYKCIQRTGSFPYAIFFSTSVAATLILIILDRLTRRLIRRDRRQDSGVQ